MQPFPIPYEPTNLVPCMTLRARREPNTVDTANSRFVEIWQTDAPALTNARRDVTGTAWWQDMNPTPSRLYRENVQQAQPYVLPGQTPVDASLEKKLQTTYGKMDLLSQALRHERNPDRVNELKTSLATAKEMATTTIQQQRQLEMDALASNPYFQKYDIAGDSRNVIRELRGAVSEDIVDRGVRENRVLLRREMENRWLPSEYAEKQGMDSLQAFELMRPKFNDMSKTYR